MLRKSLLFASLTTLGLAACAPQQDAEDAFRAGVPTADTVRVRTPGAATQGQGLSAAEGDRAGGYAFTKGATDLVNGVTYVVLHTVERITQYPPTSVSGETAVWGPHSEPLDARAWRLTVTRTGAGTYAWELDAKAKTADDAAFVTVLSGTHAAALDAAGEPQRGFGSGSFTFDFDAAAALPDAKASDVGTLQVDYARASATADTTVDAKFRNVAKDGNPAVRQDADYRYRASPGAGGSFEFGWDANIDPAYTSRPAAERLTIKSRWLQTGAGRSDVRARGGDLGSAEAQVSECWDTGFTSQYLRYSWEAAPAYGVEATDCAFPSADYSSLVLLRAAAG